MDSVSLFTAIFFTIKHGEADAEGSARGSGDPEVPGSSPSLSSCEFSVNAEWRKITHMLPTLAIGALMIGNETPEKVEENILYLGQTVSAYPVLYKEIKRRIGMGWSALGKHGDAKKQQSITLRKDRCTVHLSLALIYTSQN